MVNFIEFHGNVLSHTVQPKFHLLSEKNETRALQALT
jgi:hypothetical protein